MRFVSAVFFLFGVFLLSPGEGAAGLRAVSESALSGRRHLERAGKSLIVGSVERAAGGKIIVRLKPSARVRKKKGVQTASSTKSIPGQSGAYVDVFDAAGRLKMGLLRFVRAKNSRTLVFEFVQSSQKGKNSPQPGWKIGIPPSSSSSKSFALGLFYELNWK